MSALPAPHDALKLEPLSREIGAEILGVDLSRALDERTFSPIRDALHAHGVILFRGQTLSEEDQVRFASRFGPLGGVLNRHDGASRHHPGVMFISNIREDGKLIGALPDGEMMFHSDQCYAKKPCDATMLYAIEIPSRGGNTLFLNAAKAYETLPDDLRRRLDGACAVNVYDYANAATKRSKAAPDAPRYAHPVFRTHPATGKKSLYVNRLMTASIVGMDERESEAVLTRLFDHMENGDWIYEHRWTPGDLLMWDNRSTLHARTDFDASERRLLRRCVILGGTPY